MASTAVGLARYMFETKQTEVELQVEETYWQVVSLASKEQLLTRLVELLDNAVKDVDVAIKGSHQGRWPDHKVKRSEAEQKY